MHVYAGYGRRRLTAARQAPSWGLDRIDQLYRPLNGIYDPGSLDGSGIHGTVYRSMNMARII